MKAIFKTAWPYKNDRMNLPVRNLEAAVPFYETIMGFELVARNDSPCRSAVFRRDHVEIGLAENGGDPTQDVQDVFKSGPTKVKRGLTSATTCLTVTFSM